MTNDITTLNGALTELGETMADNLITQGVNASASDGLTTLANKILDIQGSGSCYHIEFVNSSYTTVGTETVSVFVQENYQPLANTVVTFTSNASTTTTAITDSNGIATATITFNASTTLTASCNNVSDTCTVNVLRFYFIDDCSVDNTSNYTSYGIQGTSGKVNILYDSVETAYKIINNTTSGRALLQFGDILLQNDVRISADIKVGGTNYNNNGMLAFIDKDSQSTYSVAGWVQGQKYYRLVEFNGTSELQTTPNSIWSRLSTSDYNHHELTFSNGVVTYTITTPSNNTKTLTLTLQQNNYIGGKLGLFVEVFNSSTACYIKNIIAEPI